MDTIFYSMRLNDTRGNLTSNPERSPLFARFPLMFVPFMQYAG